LDALLQNIFPPKNSRARKPVNTANVTYVIASVTKFTVLFKIPTYIYFTFFPVMKKTKQYSGKLEIVPGKQIFLNINNLAKGIYTLRIMLNNKVVKEITFKK
jgi:hypothetical protein